MHVLVTGGTGFIGKALCPALTRAGHRVTVLTRNRHRLHERRGDIGYVSTLDAAEPAEVVVNLAGESLTAGRWNNTLKQRIRESRIGTTRALYDWVAAQPAISRPQRLVSGSAVGFYGDGGERRLDEDAPPGEDFAAQLCRDWEAEAMRLEALGVRVALLRTGVVLGKHGGALARMLPAFRLGAGGQLGHGQHWMSWIHREDLVGLLLWLLEHGGSGAYNGTAPAPVTNAEFTRVLGELLHRPTLLTMPEPMLRLLFGEMTDLLLVSQRVLPQRAVREGFGFRHRDLRSALQAIID